MSRYRSVVCKPSAITCGPNFHSEKGGLKARGLLFKFLVSSPLKSARFAKE